MVRSIGQFFSALNQILCGHSRLNGHQAKLNPNKSEMCDKCKVSESVEHYLFDCDRYEEETKKSWKNQWKMFYQGKA